MKNLLILGGGTAGTILANRARRELPTGWQVTVVDRDDAHIYQPGLLFVPFGTYRARDLVRPRRRQLHGDVDLVLGDIQHLDLDGRTVQLADGTKLAWDLLVVATGVHLAPGETEGLLGPRWQEDIFEFYTLDGAAALRDRLRAWEGGRLVVHLDSLPIKCPVAPLEFALLADAHLTERGLRDKTEIVLATPLDGAFTKPIASAAIGDLMERRNITIEADFNTQRVVQDTKTLHAWDGRGLQYDLLVTVPPHTGAPALKDSGLTDELGWVRVDRHTLRAVAHPDVYSLGDATNVPTSKAGSTAHFQAELMAENLVRHARGMAPEPTFDGHANCFIETGHGKALLIDFNYETEPLPGRFPLPGVGPFTLLEESETNHWGKLAFRWMYWNMLLPGHELPLEARMTSAGKWSCA